MKAILRRLDGQTLPIRGYQQNGPVIYPIGQPVELSVEDRQQLESLQVRYADGRREFFVKIEPIKSRIPNTPE